MNFKDTFEDIILEIFPDSFLEYDEKYDEETKDLLTVVWTSGVQFLVYSPKNTNQVTVKELDIQAHSNVLMEPKIGVSTLYLGSFPLTDQGYFDREFGLKLFKSIRDNR